MVDLPENGGIAAVIAAAGSSERFGGDKTESLICGKPCLVHTLCAFERSGQTVQTVVVTKKEKMSAVLSLKETYGLKKLTAVCEGGNSRQESAAKGFAAADPSVKFIAVHDAARPLITPEDIDRVALEAYRYGAAIAALRQVNTVKLVEDGFVKTTVAREQTVSAATPQIFSREIYERLIREFYGCFSAFTDDSSMAEKLGIKVKAVICDDTNIKITSPSDILIARAIFSERRE